MKIYIVVFEEYAHGSKILEDSKVFLDKSQAQQFCDSLNAEPSDWWEDNGTINQRDGIFAKPNTICLSALRLSIIIRGVIRNYERRDFVV